MAMGAILPRRRARPATEYGVITRSRAALYAEQEAAGSLFVNNASLSACLCP